MSDPELEAFQALLLEELVRGTPPAELRDKLLADPAAAPFRDYVERFEPRFVEMAARIVQKWALRRT